jgi:hypothetical protein
MPERPIWTRRFSSGEICEVGNITDVKLRNWTQRGFLKTATGAVGSGRPNIYGFDQVLCAEVMMMLWMHDLRIERAARLGQFVASQFAPDWLSPGRDAVWLVVPGGMDPEIYRGRSFTVTPKKRGAYIVLEIGPCLKWISKVTEKLDGQI